MLTATQNTGGVAGPTTRTVAVAVLLAVFVSVSLPTTVTVFTWLPVVLGVVAKVIVTVPPAAIVRRLQLRIAPLDANHAPSYSRSLDDRPRITTADMTMVR